MLPQIAVTDEEAATFTFYDAYSGTELTPVNVNSSTEDATLTTTTTTLVLEVAVEGNGIGAVLATTAATAPQDLASFLADMTAMTADLPLSSFSWEWTYLQQTMVPASATRTAPLAAAVATTR